MTEKRLNQVFPQLNWAFYSWFAKRGGICGQWACLTCKNKTHENPIHLLIFFLFDFRCLRFVCSFLSNGCISSTLASTRLPHPLVAQSYKPQPSPFTDATLPCRPMHCPNFTDSSPPTTIILMSSCVASAQHRVPE